MTTAQRARLMLLLDLATECGDECFAACCADALATEDPTDIAVALNLAAAIEGHDAGEPTMTCYDGHTLAPGQRAADCGQCFEDDRLADETLRDGLASLPPRHDCWCGGMSLLPGQVVHLPDCAERTGAVSL